MTKKSIIYKLQKENEQLRKSLANKEMILTTYAKAIVEPEKLEPKILSSIQISATIKLAGANAQFTKWEDKPIDFYVGAKNAGKSMLDTISISYKDGEGRDGSKFNFLHADDAGCAPSFHYPKHRQTAADFPKPQTNITETEKP